MGVSLFTVRIVLSVLGVVDYGIYNVVAGVVSMFGFLSGTMASASQRFFAYEIGRNDPSQLKKTFNTTIIIYLILALVIVILAETIGLWFLYNKMTIPPDRFNAALWTYQFAIASFVITIMVVPYSAAIIAKENMKIYAVISIVEVALKLIIVYILLLFEIDKLKLYAVLMFLSTIIISSLYPAYCLRKYSEFRFNFFWEKDIFKTLLSYSGWNLFGAIASVLNSHGVNILLNVFFSPVINAARAIAMQINSVVNQFIHNFMLASRPQITKYYAEERIEEMFDLVFKSSKFSFYLLSIIAIPIIIKIEYILNLWLKEVPDFTIIFSRLILIVAMIDSFSYSLMASAQATGKIKKYQAIVGSVLMLNVPISYIFLRLGFSPEWTLYIAIIISIICLFLRLLLLKEMLQFPISNFIINAIITPTFVVALGLITPLIVHVNIVNDTFFTIILFGIIYILSTIVSIYFFGLTKDEKLYFLKFIKR